jgi:hypothetical protein
MAGLVPAINVFGNADKVKVRRRWPGQARHDESNNPRFNIGEQQS